jgi:hypothetical protein
MTAATSWVHTQIPTTKRMGFYSAMVSLRQSMSQGQPIHWLINSRGDIVGSYQITPAKPGGARFKQSHLLVDSL